jgi:hypothetical protein
MNGTHGVDSLMDDPRALIATKVLRDTFVEYFRRQRSGLIAPLFIQSFFKQGDRSCPN